MRTLPILVVVACGGSAKPGTVEWQPPRELATGGGERGPWQQNESRFDHIDDPTVVLAADGSALVAWVDHRTKDVLVQGVGSRGAPRWEPPTNVSRTPAVFSWLPRIAHDGTALHVLWQEIVFSGGSHGGDIFYARSRDDGRTFETPRNLSASIAGDGKGRIDAKRWSNGSLDLVTARGAVWAAWTEYEGRLWIARSTTGGESWEAPSLVYEDTARPARGPALAVSPAGAHLAWTTGEDPRSDILVATARDDGSFAPPVIVAKTPAYSDAPKLAVDDAGTLHLVYAESAGGPFDAFEVHYTRSRDGGASFEAPRRISRPHPGDAESAAFPSLALSGRSIHVVWELYPDHARPPRGLGHVMSRDGGDSFSAPAIVPHSVDPSGGGNGSFQGRLMRKLAVRDDAIVVVNSSLAPGRGSRVWMMRGRVR